MTSYLSFNLPNSTITSNKLSSQKERIDNFNELFFKYCYAKGMSKSQYLYKTIVSYKDLLLSVMSWPWLVIRYPQSHSITPWSHQDSERKYPEKLMGWDKDTYPIIIMGNTDFFFFFNSGSSEVESEGRRTIFTAGNTAIFTEKTPHLSSISILILQYWSTPLEI